MKKRTATITFHAAHNYGSMLQAYALQKVLQRLGVENEIINFRTIHQKIMYADPAKKVNEPFSNKLKNQLIHLLIPSYKKSIKRKYELFENFLRDNLNLTKEYTNSEDLSCLVKKYDYFITGSDQCWNTTCGDFDWVYYLTFTDSTNKIGYATSLGPMKPGTHFEEIGTKIDGFKAISAREEGTAKYISKIVGRKIPIMPDPTLLLTKDDWDKMKGNQPIINKPYIFLYAPHYQEGLLEVADRVASILHLPIVISNITRYRKDLNFKITHPKAKYKLDVGPKEFLNLIANAELVISGSFHAILFSIIFQRPFFAFNGLNDNRMRHILDVCDLSARSLTSPTTSKEITEYSRITFKSSEEWISQQRNAAIEFLSDSLDLNRH